MKTELEDMLKNNPWNKAEIEAWKAILKTGQSGEFILKEDVDIIASYNRKCKNEGELIQTYLLPQPFIGNPEAPIWILTLNPGYCEIDLYDMLGKKEEIKDWLEKEKVETESKESLKKRQELLLKQLRFEESRSFYVLDDCFNTLKEHAGNKSFGGYEWWKKHLLGTKNSKLFCKGEKKMLSKFFALEFFPYHSRNFSKKLSKIEVAHSKFWKELVSYALKRGKLLICRNEKIIKEIQKFPDFEKNKDNVLRFSSQRIFLSNGNLIPLGDYASERKEDVKKHAAELVYAALNK